MKMMKETQCQTFNNHYEFVNEAYIWNKFKSMFFSWFDRMHLLLFLFHTFPIVIRFILNGMNDRSEISTDLLQCEICVAYFFVDFSFDSFSKMCENCWRTGKILFIFHVIRIVIA